MPDSKFNHKAKLKVIVATSLMNGTFNSIKLKIKVNFDFDSDSDFGLDFDSDSEIS